MADEKYTARPLPAARRLVTNLSEDDFTSLEILVSNDFGLALLREACEWRWEMRWLAALKEEAAKKAPIIPIDRGDA